MIIRRADKLEDILQCVPMEVDAARKGRSRMRAQDLILFSQFLLNDPRFLFQVATSDDGLEVYGYCCAIVLNVPDRNGLHLLSIHATTPELQSEFWDNLCEFASMHNLKELFITADGRNQKAICRKWGFAPVGMVLRRRLKNGLGTR